MSSPKIDRVLDLAVLGLLSAVVASLAIRLVPFSDVIPALLDGARAVVATGHTPMPFFQTGYVAALALGLWLCGPSGITVVNALAYVLSVLLAYVLVTVAGGRRPAALVAGLLVATHPYMVVNIKRIEDNNLAIPSLLGLAIAVVWIWRGGKGIRVAITTGLIAGIAVLTRSNFAPVMLLALWPLVKQRRFVDAATVVAIALSLVMIANQRLTGHWRLAPTSGAYNFYIGANEFTADSLLRDYNAEDSLLPALKADHVDLEGMDPYAFANAHTRLFWKLGLRYIINHPVEYVGLGMLKILTTFRPNYRLIATSKAAPMRVLAIVQTGLALIAILWITTRAWLARMVGVFDGVLAIPIVTLLLIPLFLFNGDPRFRRPIEIIAAADTIWCWDAWLRNHRNISHPQKDGAT